MRGSLYKGRARSPLYLLWPAASASYPLQTKASNSLILTPICHDMAVYYRRGRPEFLPWVGRPHT
jgi:hypothetical protein